MKNKKKLFGILNLLAGIILICFGFFAVKPKVIAPVINLPLQNVTEAVSTTSSTIEKKPQISNSSQSSINFLINGKSQILNFTQGDTLEKVIKDAVSKNLIDVKGTNFSGLGFFVDSINGTKQGNGYSWIYYINEKKATVGASTYKLQNNDSINWVYEKNY
ncbi:MAG: DUF4430 domain-containing protein [bacterium]